MSNEVTVINTLEELVGYAETHPRNADTRWTARCWSPYNSPRVLELRRSGDGSEYRYWGPQLQFPMDGIGGDIDALWKKNEYRTHIGTRKLTTIIKDLGGRSVDAAQLIRNEETARKLSASSKRLEQLGNDLSAMVDKVVKEVGEETAAEAVEEMESLSRKLFDMADAKSTEARRVRDGEADVPAPPKPEGPRVGNRQAELLGWFESMEARERSVDWNVLSRSGPWGKSETFEVVDSIEARGWIEKGEETRKSSWNDETWVCSIFTLTDAGRAALAAWTAQQG